MALVSADIGSAFFCVAKRFSAQALRLRRPCLLPLSLSRRLSFAAGVGVYRTTSKESNHLFPLTTLKCSRAFSRRFATNASTTLEDSDVLTKIPPDDRIPATIITGFLGSGKHEDGLATIFHVFDPRLSTLTTRTA